MNNKRISAMKEPVYIRYREVCDFYCIGRTKARNLCMAAGAVSKVGKAVLIDKNKLDAYISSLSVDAGNAEECDQ